MSGTAHFSDASEVERVLTVRNAPAYDPALPAFDRSAVVALCAASGITVTERAVKFASIRGELASHKVAGRIRWSEADVVDWLRGTRRVGTSGGAA
nr:hypothetical protein [Prescottella equi]